MSRIFGYPHEVKVTVMKTATDRAGVKESVPDRTVTVPCKIEPVSATEMAARGMQDYGTAAVTAMKILADDWPGGIFSEIDWNGRKFNQAGEALRHTAGYFTQGVSVIIAAQNAAHR